MKSLVLITLLIVILISNIIWLFSDFKSWLLFNGISLTVILLLHLIGKALVIPKGCCKVCQGIGILDNFLTCTVCKGTGQENEV